jgi:hypothetical protein
LPAAEAADIWDDDVAPYKWDNDVAPYKWEDGDGAPNNNPMLVYRSSMIWIPPKGGIIAKCTHAVRFLYQVIGGRPDS